MEATELAKVIVEYHKAIGNRKYVNVVAMREYASSMYDIMNMKQIMIATTRTHFIAEFFEELSFLLEN